MHPQNVFGKTVKLLLALYDRMGDRISLQYGGSNAHRKANGGVQADPNLAVARSELGTSIKRHYANAMLDRSKQVRRRKGLALPCPALPNPMSNVLTNTTIVGTTARVCYTHRMA